MEPNFLKSPGIDDDQFVAEIHAPIVEPPRERRDEDLRGSRWPDSDLMRWAAGSPSTGKCCVNARSVSLASARVSFISTWSWGQSWHWAAIRRRSLPERCSMADSKASVVTLAVFRIASIFDANDGRPDRIAVIAVAVHP